ncbi:MAG: hypothetical protein M9945_14125 [Aquamicrobium sp.]|uniref:hypothetical protein n=1 Tax=Aquamicrobium sp. TaxID=1872579 RepID=UPI00349EC5CD|nr:hypothetical protein [Aquamicrobium sp.]
MLTVEEFKSLEVGDVVDTESLFPSLTQEKVSFHVQERTEREVRFVATFLNITLGRWMCRLTGGKLEWSK